MLAVTPYPRGFVLPPVHIHTFRPFDTHHIHPWTRLCFGSTQGICDECVLARNHRWLPLELLILLLHWAESSLRSFLLSAKPLYLHLQSYTRLRHFSLAVSLLIDVTK